MKVTLLKGITHVFIYVSDAYQISISSKGKTVNNIFKKAFERL